MEKESSDIVELMLHAQADIWKYMLNFVDSMALKCVVELRIADIIHSYGCPITLSQMASSIGSPSPDVSSLARIMRLLVDRKIFTASPQSDGGEILYGLTHSSMWLLRDAEMSLAPMVLLQNDERKLAPFHHLSSVVREGKSAFEKAHGCNLWEYRSLNPDFNDLYNDGMKCTAKFVMRVIIQKYKDLFDGMESVVDVGGGTGAAMAEIVKAHPHIKGINFDLPYVIATAPECKGVSHVGGDMFKAVSNADAVLMKSVLHDWNDEDCVKILKICRNAIPMKKGKVILVETVLNPEGDDMPDNTVMGLDLLMIAHSYGGKERTELEWKKLLNEAGFPLYNITKLPAVMSIIEAYPG